MKEERLKQSVNLVTISQCFNFNLKDCHTFSIEKARNDVFIIIFVSLNAPDNYWDEVRFVIPAKAGIHFQIKPLFLST